MKNFKLLYIYVLVLVTFISACEKDEEVPRGEFASGVIIVNEGNFGENDGAVSFFDPTTETATQDIYEKANSESVSGYFGSIYFYEDKAYLLDQAGNKIVVVEAETFKYIATINEGLNVPRYMTVANGKGYISNWGPYDQNYQTPDSYIAVVDLESFTVINSLNTDNGVEGMTTVDKKVYAAASGSNKIHVIDPAIDEIVGGYEVPNGPRLFSQDGNGRLWVLCNNYVISSLAKLDLATEQVLTTFEIAGGAKAIKTNASGTKIYYLSAPYGAPTSIYEIENSATFTPQEAFISGDSFYGFGIDPSDDMVYVGISNPTANGTVVRFNSDGTELDNFPAGRFPNAFEFRK